MSTATLSLSSHQAPVSQEVALLDCAQRMDRHREDRIAVHLHLSQLQNRNRKEHYIRVATGAFEDMVKGFDGQLFILFNQDLVFVARGAKPSQIDPAVVRLRQLFSEDPLVRYTEDHIGAGFCTWYRLEADYDRFVEMARRYLELSEAERSRRNRRAALNRGPAPAAKPLTPALLGRLEEMLQTADLTPLIRRQPVCIVSPDQPPCPVFQEIYVSIADLEQALMPSVSATADPWLFQRLTNVLDRRMLSLMLHEKGCGQSPFSLNLNVASVLSKEFQRFDRGVGLGVHGKLVVELQKVDIFHDMGAYLFARDFLRERGYKICLDGMTHMTLPMVDRERLGLDLIKMYWSPELASGDFDQSTLAELGRQVTGCGQARLIITRCDNEDALRVGHQLGASLFQGRVVDRALKAQKLPAGGSDSAG